MELGVSNIGAFAFASCEGLDQIVIPAGVEVIGATAFADCAFLKIYCEVAEKPDGWADTWAGLNTVVFWGYQGN